MEENEGEYCEIATVPLSDSDVFGIPAASAIGKLLTDTRELLGVIK